MRTGSTSVLDPRSVSIELAQAEPLLYALVQVEAGVVEGDRDAAKKEVLLELAAIPHRGLRY